MKIVAKLDRGPSSHDAVDVERHNRHLVVRVNGKLAATRDETTNTIAWALGVSEHDKAILRREVFDKIAPNFNRRERRRLAHARRVKR